MITQSRKTSRLSLLITVPLALMLGCEEEVSTQQGEGGEAEAGATLITGGEGAQMGGGGGEVAGSAGGVMSGAQAGQTGGAPQGGVTGRGDAGASMGGGVSEACATSCAALSACVSEGCEGADQSVVQGLCEARCTDFAPFSEIASGIDSCTDWISFAGQQLGDEFSAQCEVGPPPPAEPLPECEPFAARLSACVTERCENFAPIQSDAEQILRTVCAQQVANGEVPLTTFAAVTDETSCEQQTLTAYLTFLLERNPLNPESGPFVELCEEGPQVSAETCATACEHVGPCIPEGSDGEALRDGATCRYICAIAPDVDPSVWQCLEEADAGGCLSVGQCFQ